MVDDYSIRAGHALRSRREELGLSQRDVVNALAERGRDIGAPALARIERGERNLSFPLAVTWAEVLNFPIRLLAESTQDSFERVKKELWRVVKQAIGCGEDANRALSELSEFLEENPDHEEAQDLRERFGGPLGEVADISLALRTLPRQE